MVSISEQSGKSSLRYSFALQPDVDACTLAPSVTGDTTDNKIRTK
ncbi:MAG TPA: hypothetical protein VFW11_02390 [Cyclobacteriaceae bacterium]|nr:hypothetical protein [Cyclobacteriaceae bacterium]